MRIHCSITGRTMIKESSNSTCLRQVIPLFVLVGPLMESSPKKT